MISLKGSPVSSKLLLLILSMCIENWNFNVSSTILQTHEHVHNVQIQRWSCFVDNVSSRAKVTQRPWLIVKNNFNHCSEVVWFRSPCVMWICWWWSCSDRFVSELLSVWLAVWSRLQGEVWSRAHWSAHHQTDRVYCRRGTVLHQDHRRLGRWRDKLCGYY